MRTDKALSNFIFIVFSFIVIVLISPILSIVLGILFALLYRDKANNISKKISSLIQKYKPKLFILLGDRYEVLSVALAAYISKIPIAHIHGGEITSGSLDDGFRHCISKLSSIHFVTHTSHKKRLTQLMQSR